MVFVVAALRGGHGQYAMHVVHRLQGSGAVQRKTRPENNHSEASLLESTGS